MSGKGQKHILEVKRQRMRSLGRDLDIVDKVRLQRLKEKRDQENEMKTGDIYDQEERDEMLKEDEITETEYAFMEGREKADKKQRRDLGL